MLSSLCCFKGQHTSPALVDSNRCIKHLHKAIKQINMFYYSTNRQSPRVNFREATIRGQAPDKGLYFPETVPHWSKNFTTKLDHYSNEGIAFKVIQPYTGKTIPSSVLETIVSETIDFRMPLVQLSKEISVLELFHGPTLAFKDVGARFMSRCLAYFLKDNDREVTVLVATSGDTGGAVASAFSDVAGVRVVILFPAGKISAVQELQLTTHQQNVRAVAVHGNFDDCQQLVKQAFADKAIHERVFLTSANSINVARWLPQQVYYWLASKQWKDKLPPVISVPSGNLGNLCAGLVAQQSGLPVHHFIAACNANDAVTKFLRSGTFAPQQTIVTSSNAMDVGHPNNFIRLLELFKHDYTAIKEHVSSFSISDQENIEIIKALYSESGYLLDPHGAAGFLSLKKYVDHHPRQKGIFLATAHPAKFSDAITRAIDVSIQMPQQITALSGRERTSIAMDVNYEALKALLFAR